MHDILSNLLSDKKGGMVFTCFGTWHLFYISAVALISVFFIYYIKRNKDKAQKIINLFINIAFTIMIADYFLMPLAYGEIDVEKLPFHVCTAMCVMCFFSRHNAFLGRFKLHFALLGFLSNLVYLIYPAGVMWHQVHPVSYRVIETLLFHGFMTVYGLLVLIYDECKLDWKKCYKDLIVIVSMTIWALLGNFIYNSDTRVYNWFFVVQDPFNMFSSTVAPYIMPFLNILVFFVAEMLIYSICFLIKKILLTKH